MVEVGQALSPEFKKYGYKIPDKEMSYCAAKILSWCAKPLKRFLGIWNKRRPISNKKSLTKLGIKSYKPLKDTCIEMAWALIKQGIVEDKTKGK